MEAFGHICWCLTWKHFNLKDGSPTQTNEAIPITYCKMTTSSSGKRITYLLVIRNICAVADIGSWNRKPKTTKTGSLELKCFEFECLGVIFLLLIQQLQWMWQSCWSVLVYDRGYCSAVKMLRGGVVTAGRLLPLTERHRCVWKLLKQQELVAVIARFLRRGRRMIVCVEK